MKRPASEKGGRFLLRIFISRGRKAAHVIENGRVVAKVCGDCGELLDLDCFDRLRKGFAGRQSVCKACMHQRKERGHASNRIAKAIRFYDENGICIAKVCPGCQTKKDRSEYRNVSSTSDGLDVHCKDCTSSRIKEWLANNPEKAQVYANRRRALKSALPDDLTPGQWYAIRYGDFDNRCALSGKRSKLSLDHWIAISTGHSGTIIGNVYPLNRSLNSSKGDMNPCEWIKRHEKYREKFEALERYLANQNGLSVEEFREFTYFCYENPRTVDEILRSGGLTSLELWRRGRC